MCDKEFVKNEEFYARALCIFGTFYVMNLHSRFGIHGATQESRAPMRTRAVVAGPLGALGTIVHRTQGDGPTRRWDPSSQMVYCQFKDIIILL